MELNKLSDIDLLKIASFQKCNNIDKSKSDLISFIQYNNNSYTAKWFHKIIAQKCEKVITGEIKKLMIFVPPQHGKSEIVSRNLPAFALGVNPNLKIAGCSYSADLSEGFSRDIQRTIDSESYQEIFPETTLNGSNIRTDAKKGFIRTVEKFEIVGKKGSYKAVGVCGALTGNTVDIGIIDDPVKDAIEANSYTYRERVWDWYVNVFCTRLHNESRQIIMMTRWHDDDLAGRLLKLEPEAWNIVCFEGICENKYNYDIRNIGEALWEEKHSKERLLHIMSLSPQTFGALIQQNPITAQSGNEFLKGFNIREHIKDLNYNDTLQIHISIDNNVFPYIAITVWQIEKCENGFYKINQIHELPARDPINTARKAGQSVVEYLQSIGYNGDVYLYGDPTTKQRNSIDDSKKSFLSLFIEPFGKASFDVEQRFFSKAPIVASTGEFINAIFENRIENLQININSECLVSISDYQNTKKDADGSMLKQRVKDPTSGISYEKNGHILDTLRYFICKAFSTQFDNFKNRNTDYSKFTAKNTHDFLQGF